MTIEIRRVTPADVEKLADFYGALSRESLHARFLGTARAISGSTARLFCTPDHMHEEGFVAIVPTDIGQPFVGHVCLNLVDQKTVELGIAVADDWQGLGIGRRLFATAVSWVRDHGFETIVASCFSDNWRVLALLSSAPHAAMITAADGGVVDVVIPMRGPIPRDLSRPPYPKLRRRRGIRRRSASWPRTRQPARVAGG